MFAVSDLMVGKGFFHKLSKTNERAGAEPVLCRDILHIADHLDIGRKIMENKGFTEKYMKAL